MRGAALLLIVLAALPACGRASPDAGTPTRSAEAPPVVDPGEACPECAGSGLSPRSGDGRPCLLCDGDGRCAICGGEGRDRDGRCFACDAEGKCTGCGGDGRVDRARGDIGPAGAPLPGQCPVCRYGQGGCPECEGTGRVPFDRECALCAGERWCPLCRGSGADPWCGGSGLCPTCRGHGRLADGRPVEGWPPLRVILRDGDVIEATLLAKPDRYFSWARDEGGRSIRETVLASRVDPVTVIVALRRYATAPEDHLAIARYALDEGGSFLFVARREIEAARGTSGSLAAEELAARADLAWREFREGAAGDAAPVAAADEETLARKRAAEADRYRRDVRRSAAWRARAETLLAANPVALTTALRALRAAEEAWRLAARAANRAPPDAAIDEARAEVTRVRRTRVRALLSAADRLLVAGRVERARAVGAVALAVDPDDEAARRFAAVVTEALARSRLAEDTR